MSKIAVAMSGGMDSTTVAWMLQQEGHEIVGITMKLFPNPIPGTKETFIEDAQAICQKLNIEHHVVDLSEMFEEQIITPFIKAYLHGLTPSPCMMCNPILKFGTLFEIAQQYGCTHLATGHYINLGTDPDGSKFITRGDDPRKDQSYFLARLSRDQVQHALFPLGNKQKSDVKAQAISLGLIEKEKGESQDLCFIPNGDYVRFILDRHPELAKPGNIVDSSGKILGKHQGFFAYTIGQRRGLGLSGGPWFVLHIDPLRNLIVIGREEELSQHEFFVRDLNWQSISTPPVNSEIDVMLQIRYAMTPIPAKVVILPENKGRIVLSKPLRGITPGQGAVFYRENRLLGGAWIDFNSPINMAKENQ